MKEFILKYKVYIAVFVAIVVGISIYLSTSDSVKETVVATKQHFVVSVTALGEVDAEKFTSIKVPDVMKERRLRIWSLSITNLVNEGTILNKGDFVATLDPSEVEQKIQERYEDLEAKTITLENAVLDSTLALEAAKHAIETAQDNVLEAEITQEQSQFESKAIQRQAEIALEQAQLSLNSTKRNLQSLTTRHKVRIKRYKERVDRVQDEYDKLQLLKTSLNVVSPADGMVVYGKDHGNNKIKIGSSVGPWEPTIATIPNLNTLVSVAQVQEIDISKVKVGQEVEIQVDAFPDETFKGEVKFIANIGEAMSTGMNGFEVNIHLELQGGKILPGMTTTNKITVKDYPDALVLPREAVFGNDTLKYVFLDAPNLPKQVKVSVDGENETHMRIVSGINEGDKVLLYRPDEFIEE